jgi:hypothetical protein
MIKAKVVTISWIVAVMTLCFTASTMLHSQTKTITAADAKDHVGERATVCGTVISAKYSSGSKGQPTFLNLDEPYPKEVFTIVIWGSDRPKFDKPGSKYRDQRVCVTGKIVSYRGGCPKLPLQIPVNWKSRNSERHA